MVDTEKVLEFDKIKEMWSSYAMTEWAKEEIKVITPYLSENELSARQRETTEARNMIEICGTPPLTSFTGVKEWIETARKGDCLSPMQLEGIENALVAVMRLKRYLNKGKSLQISLAYYEENLDGLEDLKETIQLQIRNGRIDDSASKLLRWLRTETEKTENRMREKADSVMRANKECMADSFSTYRNGHICIPVKKEYKFKISGTVIGKSSTGSTLFIEPTSAGKCYEELQVLMADMENEERRILYTLTAMVADQAEVLEQDMKMIEKLDFIFSKGRLSLEYEGTEPQITTERRIRLKEGRHPLLDKNSCVPLQFEIGDGVTGVVITGPNTGGKTVAIKTVALTCIMAQCGLHVACREALVCMNSNYLCDIGDGQNLSENLSTFSAHITNVLDILRKVNQNSLVIMDELGSGTDPTEGMGIAIAILEELKKSRALFLVTTHYPEVKQYAEHESCIINARMTFDKESLRPLYQMVLGEAGESCALSIAKKMGMPDWMLKTAVEAAYGGIAPEGLELYEERMDIGERVRDAAGNEEAESKAAAGKATVNRAAESKVAERKEPGRAEFKKETIPGIQKRKTGSKKQEKARKFRLGDSVMVYPDKKIGIVCQTANDRGVLRVQMPDRKIWINHKRLKLHVAAEELYPEDYDFSIIFDTVENRKMRHQMERKFVEGGEIVVE